MGVKDWAVLAMSGFNMRAVIALCRYCRVCGIPLHLVAKNRTDPIYLTSHKKDVLLDRTSTALDIAEFCGWLRELQTGLGYRRVLIAPSSEYFNRFLLTHRAAIESSGGVVPLVEKGLYEAISDKHSFSGMCRAAGIRVPMEFDAPPREFPFVAKPLNYASSSGRQLKPYLVFDADSWREFQESEAPADFYYQEFVEGQSHYLLMYVSRSGEVTTFSQENLIQQSRGGSIVLARKSDFHRLDESGNYVAMLKQSGFFGLIMVEVRFDRQTGTSVMIEANPRMWGPIQFVLDNEVNLFGALFGDFMGAPERQFNSVAPCSEYYFWSGGLSDAAKPFALHNFTQSDFLNDFRRIESCDLFRRDDTLALHEYELTH